MTAVRRSLVVPDQTTHRSAPAAAAAAGNLFSGGSMQQRNRSLSGVTRVDRSGTHSRAGGRSFLPQNTFSSFLHRSSLHSARVFCCCQFLERSQSGHTSCPTLAQSLLLLFLQKSSSSLTLSYSSKCNIIKRSNAIQGLRGLESRLDEHFCDMEE